MASSEAKALRIEVTGSSTISRRAERAVMAVHISSSGPEQAQVSLDVTRTSNDLQQLLRSELCPKDPHTGQILPRAPVTHWSMGTLSTGSYVNWVHDHKSGESKQPGRTYTAHTDFEIKFRDFGKLGQIATQLSSLPYVQIYSISWRLTDVTKASFATQSRKDAVKDAVTKARDFAAAVGKEKVKAVLISDAGAGRHGFGFGSPGAFQTRAVAAGRGFGTTGGGREETLNFEPENCDVHCEVSVTFEAE